MWEGQVVSIHLGPRKGQPLHLVNEVQALAGQGLQGDRYCRQEGTFSSKPGPDREITLIEMEALEAFQHEHGVELTAADSRRNVATRGVRLNDLVGKQFAVGEVVLQGLRLCEPCSHLAQLTCREVLPGMVNRAGLRAQILTGGVVRVGALIRPHTPAPSQAGSAAVADAT
jgi:MOSC domain-containing protein YiiM